MAVPFIRMGRYLCRENPFQECSAMRESIIIYHGSCQTIIFGHAIFL